MRSQEDRMKMMLIMDHRENSACQMGPATFFGE